MSEENVPGKSEEVGIAVAEDVKVKRPRMYKVLMHNDDYTTMEFVIHVLQKIFKKTRPEAQAVMLAVHTQGVGVCGIFTLEIAESKVQNVIKYAREKGHPLKCSTEPCDP